MNETLEQIKEYIETLSGKDLETKLFEYHPYDIATVLDDLDDDKVKEVLESIDPKLSADILAYMDTSDTADLLEDLDLSKTSDIIEEMETDDAADIINELDEDVKEDVLENIDKDIKEDIISLSNYTEEEAGSIMTDNFLAMDVKMKVKDAMNVLVKESNEQEMIDVLFVTENEKIVGTIDLKDLIVARKNDDIINIMSENFKYVVDTDNIKAATNLIKDYNLMALPVTDSDMNLLGIITIDDAIDYVDEDVTDDYDLMAGIVGDNTIKFFDVIKSRLLWLVILLFLSLLVSTVMNGFEGVISSITCLVFFQSLILDMGGNAGTQALATSVVEISQNTLDSKGAIFKHLAKEFVSGFLNALILSAIAFGMSYLFIEVRSLTSTYPTWSLSMVISLALLVGLTVSNFLGSIVPIILFKLHIDPAVASGPFISTLNDIVSVCIYYGLAYLILILGGII